ncbi:MAG: hypothetical protein U0790_23140 [Isosphaeraceae bacterium]
MSIVAKRRFFLLVLAQMTLVCVSGFAEDKGAYKDDRYHFQISIPGPWKEAPVSNYKVPGTVRAAWAGKGNSSIVAFVQEPGQAFTPRFLLDASAKAMETQLGAKVLEKEVRKIAGKQAMWLSFEAKGTGGAIVPNGEILTTQHWVAIPRETDIVVLLLTCRSEDYQGIEKGFSEALKDLKVEGEQTAEQASSK